MDLYKEYLSKKEALENAKTWNDLPNGRKYQNDKFDISLPHCKALSLERAGQQYCGGQNYWKSPPELNQAIMEFIYTNHSTIIQSAILIMEENTKKSLKKCQVFVDSLQKKITEES